MTNSPSAMPGAFNFHQPSQNTGSVPRLSGAKSHLFQPPRTPGSASSSLVLSRSTTTGATGYGSRPSARKRTLNDYHESSAPPTPRMTNEWEREIRREKTWAGVEGADWTPVSPMTFEDTRSRYEGAGEVETPNHDGRHDYLSVGYRKTLTEEEDKISPIITRAELFSEHDGMGYFALGQERSVKSRGRTASQSGSAWRKGAISVVGAVVGKAWEFCKAGATVFTGFRAGGGQAYKVENIDSIAHFEAVENESNWEAEKLDWEREGREGTPIPGQFPDEDFIPDYMDTVTPDQSPARPSKRRQVSGGFRDEESKNWVVVNQITPSATPTKVQHQASPRYSLKPTRLAPRRSLVPVGARPASRAGLTSSARQSILPRGSHAGSPGLQSNHGASYASARSPASINRASKIPRASPMRDTKSSTAESPAAKEAKKWHAMKKKEDREADESMRRLDAKLKAMIREGKEALGTKVEVEIEDDYDFEDTSKRRWL